ncbi:SLAP domain-containing protein [Fictibacillus sp. b24]|uniref:SLAP domain-containing protein n=1 Tax=Fictibacillus sp. b24 TaxID=3055863 RepID=UPI0025A1D42F|nr:SLAP domain-containing protein [Fictibacillus sp. b24]MDM5314612.1 SLAP domain-containing protein [Fictibacillus sp. b24]
MQNLAFESAWDRTLAHQDRSEIERVFSRLDHDQKVGQQAVILKTAFNHKEEFLVTVLVNNYSKEPFSLEGKKVVYNEGGELISEMKSQYVLEIPAQTSMPWTFIFPAAALKKMPSKEFGELIIN